MLFKQLRYSCVAGLVFLIFGWNNTYAEAGSPDNRYGFGKLEDQSNVLALTDAADIWRRVGGWENPITGQGVSLSKVYRHSTNIPGLSWKVIFFARANEDPSYLKIATEFDFFIMKLPMLHDFPDRNLEDYDLKPDSYRRKICGQEILQGTAIDKKGKSYAFSQLQFILGEDQQQYSVFFIRDIAEKQVPLDKNVFCPIVQSFSFKENTIRPSANQEPWFFNPLSDKPFLADSGVKIKIEDIVSHRLGSYQAYSVTHGDLHAELIKVRGRPYVSDVFEMDNIKTLHLTDGTVFHWEDRGYKTGIHTKGHFTQVIAGGKERSGLVFGALGQDVFVVVKVWQVDGKALTADERNWAEELLKNSIPD